MIRIALVLALTVPVLLFVTGLSQATVNLKSMLASPIDLTIYSPDGKLVIGHAHFTIKQEDKKVEVNGNSHYLNGERDLEHLTLRYEPGDALPVVTKVQSSFLASDGSPQLIEEADFETGEASCRWGINPGEDYTAQLEPEPDTYAGAASIIPLEYALKQGQSSVTFHFFECGPKPAIFTIDAKLENGEARWSYYPGELAQMGLTPDLGWLNFVARPFIPNISVWFNPKQDYQYVGTHKSRFYRGREQVLVRNPSAVVVNPESNKSARTNLPGNAGRIAN
jgi:hypothetical protein